MSVPLPPIDLEGHCSAIVDDTLYVLSPGGFQSLQLKEKAEWKKEEIGVKVTGPACVTVVPDGNEELATLWVIGGTTDKGDYDGLQVYSFANKAWESIQTPVPVMQGRTDHSAAYLEASQSILVYAGSQGDTPDGLSSQTFEISTQPPYDIVSYSSAAPTAISPILLPWDVGSAVMIGGSVLNTQISVFRPDIGWTPLGTDLATPLGPGARGTIVEGTDGSRVLEVYDMSVSPNTVTQIILLGPDGSTAQTGQVLGAGPAPPRRRKRALPVTIADWPRYHEHLAPTAQRTDFSVVQDANGMAVISGGNDGNPVALFNQRSNAWIDADDFFNVKDQQPLKPSNPTFTTSPSASASPSMASGAGENNHDKTLRVLGIILGVLFGIAFLFVLVLFFLRIKKLKKREKEGWIEEKDHGRGPRNPNDRADSFLKETGGMSKELTPPPNTHWRQSNGNNPHSSLAIITGKFGKRFSNTRRGSNGHVQQHSNDSTAQLVRERQLMSNNKEIMELADIEKRPTMQRGMTPRQERSDFRAPSALYGSNLTSQDAHTEASAAKVNRNRSSGWSKYFATSAPTGANGLGHIPSAYIKPSDATIREGDRGILEHSRIASSSAVPVYEAEPRKTLDGQPVSYVTMGSPAFNDSRDDLAKRGSTYTEGQKGLIVDPGSRRSQSESISSYNRSTTSSARNSAYQETGATLWSPTNNSFKDHLNSRPGSSDADKRVPSRGKSSNFFPGAGTSYRPSKSSKPSSGTPSTQGIGLYPADSRDSNMTVWPGHKTNPSADYSKPAEQRLMAASTNSALPQPLLSGNTLMGPTLMGAQSDNRDSNVTVFPTGVPSAYYDNHHAQQGSLEKPINSDLAWLNLGLTNSQNRI